MNGWQRLSQAILLCGMIAAVCLQGQAVAAATHRIGLIVGNDEGHNPRRRLRFAERDARKVHQVLLELGGFEARDLLLLTGTTADRVRSAMQTLHRRARSLAREPRNTVLLLFYYSGHAGGDVLELGRTALPFSELAEYLKRSSATVRLGFVDACQSGQLVAAKGARRVPSFTLRVRDELRSAGYAIVTSSAADEVTQEAAEVRGSYFTHYLVSGLRGAADQSGDGRVTLAELYRHTYTRTRAHTRLQLSGGQRPMFEFRLRGSGELVLTDALRTRSRLRLRSIETMRAIVLDQERTTVVAELDVPAGADVDVAVAPGDYVVYLLSGKKAYRARVAVPTNGKAVLDREQHFVRHRLQQAVARGGLFRPRWTSRLSAEMLVRRFPLGSQPLSYGGALTYRLQGPHGWHGVTRLVGTGAPDSGASTNYWEVGVAVGGGYSWQLGPLDLRAELLVGGELLAQADREQRSRRSAAATYLGGLGLVAPFGRLEVHLDAAVGGRLLRLHDEGLVHSVDALVLLGAGWSWTH